MEHELVSYFQKQQKYVSEVIIVTGTTLYWRRCTICGENNFYSSSVRISLRTTCSPDRLTFESRTQHVREYSFTRREAERRKRCETVDCKLLDWKLHIGEWISALSTTVVNFYPVFPTDFRVFMKRSLK